MKKPIRLQLYQKTGKNPGWYTWYLDEASINIIYRDRIRKTTTVAFEDSDYTFKPLKKKKRRQKK